MLAVLLIIAFTTAFIAVIYHLTATSALTTRRTINRSTAMAYADAVMESLFNQWRTVMVNANSSDDRDKGVPSSSLTTLSVPTTSVVGRLPGIYAPSSAAVTAATPMLQTTTDSTGRPVPENGTTVSNRKRLYYVATVTVPYNVARGTDNVTIKRVFVRGGRSLFDYFFFGTQPRVEFHPGAPMYVNGDVYVEGELYTAHDYLHFLNDVTFTEGNTIKLSYSPDDPRPAGTTITNGGLADNWVSTPHMGPEQKLFDTPQSAMDPRFTDTNMANDTDSDQNLNNDGYHELVELPEPTGDDPLAINSTENHRLSKNADYRIEVSADNTVTIYKGQPAAGAAEVPLSTSNAEYTVLKNALTTDNAIYDIREGDYARLVTLDVEKVRVAADAGQLIDGVNVTPNVKDGFTIYIKDTSQGAVSTYLSTPGTLAIAAKTGVPAVPANYTRVTSSELRGVRLINGGKLPLSGLTIATPHAAYIQGDYNTGTTKSGTTITAQPATNTTTQYTPPNDTPSAWVSGYGHEDRPAAVIADAVNILSNSWKDDQSPKSKSSKVASSTTINCAILAGNVASNSTSYSGGVENFVRFHETWSNKYLTIKGALALLYTSKEATGKWASADYDPPNRRWYYDNAFQERTPPGFRFARSYDRGDWIAHQ
ncbi:MAG: hypothetical protein JWL90_1350 [Chthoniobacteraceae bacterium]|nr:hypothetical protein [Chthoniobacteraceae bacterium]MDB6173681.1 hypothetical protein [Chthoniobacteraceae bacterium]